MEHRALVAVPRQSLQDCEGCLLRDVLKVWTRSTENPPHDAKQMGAKGNDQCLRRSRLQANDSLDQGKQIITPVIRPTRAAGL
jgi:hypothetical protein